jgi:hypothetical protein
MHYSGIEMALIFRLDSDIFRLFSGAGRAGPFRYVLLVPGTGRVVLLRYRIFRLFSGAARAGPLR